MAGKPSNTHKHSFINLSLLLCVFCLVVVVNCSLALLLLWGLWCLLCLLFGVVFGLVLVVRFVVVVLGFGVARWQMRRLVKVVYKKCR